MNNKLNKSVLKLKQTTGLSLNECGNILKQCNGDFDKALKFIETNHKDVKLKPIVGDLVYRHTFWKTKTKTFILTLGYDNDTVLHSSEYCQKIISSIRSVIDVHYPDSESISGEFNDAAKQEIKDKLETIMSSTRQSFIYSIKAFNDTNLFPYQNNFVGDFSLRLVLSTSEKFVKDIGLEILSYITINELRHIDGIDKNKFLSTTSLNSKRSIQEEYGLEESTIIKHIYVLTEYSMWPWSIK